MGISFYLVGGSGALLYYTYAAALLGVALFVVFALFIRRFGPAAVVLPWIIFYLSVRSQDLYFTTMTPIWIMSLATVSHRDFARAWQFRPSMRLRPGWRAWRPISRRPGQIAVAALVVAPVVWCLIVAIRTPAPLDMQIASVVVDKNSRLIDSVKVDVANTSRRTIAPHFSLSNTSSMSRFMIVKQGPLQLRPGETATYVLMPPSLGSRKKLTGHVVLRAVSGNPMTLSSATLPYHIASSPSGGGAGAIYAP
jgi:hypothetical protein